MLKESFKYYKRKCPLPCLSEVLDLSKNELPISEISRVKTSAECRQDIGLIPAREWKVFYLRNKPGFIFISNPFTTIGHRYWIYRCLKHYTQKPNRLNLDAHDDVKENENWWEKCQANAESGILLMKKLRWTTLGYHHNWDTKVYEESARDVFPEDLALLSQQVANAVGFPQFSAEAAIVNYYHMDSTLSCHTDHSELYLEAPLLSFSFGQSAIFLLGGKSKEEKPVAMKIQSGDIVIMSGESRLCYHGIPAILPATSQPWEIENTENDYTKEILQNTLKQDSCHLLSSVIKDCSCDETWEPFRKYISSSRINMNVRQVLPFGKKSL